MVMFSAFRMSYVRFMCDFRTMSASSESEGERRDFSDAEQDRRDSARKGVRGAPVAEQSGQMVLLCEYDGGELIREEPVEAEVRRRLEPEKAMSPMKGRASKVRQIREGQTIFKGHRSYELMLQLQLGIRWSIG